MIICSYCVNKSTALWIALALIAIDVGISFADAMPILIPYDYNINNDNYLFIHGSNEEKQKASLYLREVCDDKSYDYALQALSDPDKWVKESAIYILGKIGNSAAIPALINVAIADKRIIETGNQTSCKDREVSIGYRARETLFNSNIHISDHPFVDMISNSEVERQALAIEALGVLHKSKYLGVIEKYLRSDNLMIRKAAVASIGHMVNGDFKALSKLEIVINDEDCNVREDVIRIAGRDNGTLGPKILLDRLDLERNDKLKALIMMLLRKKRNDDIGKALIKYLDPKYDNIKYDVAWYLSEYPVPEAHDALVLLLKDKSEEIRGFALRGLAILHSPDTLKHAKTLMASVEPYDRASAIEAIGIIRDRGMMPQLIKMFNIEKEYDYIEEAIIKAFGDIKDKRALPILLDIIGKWNTGNYDHFTLNAAIKSLYNILGNKTGEIIVPLLAHEHPAVKCNVIDTLGIIKDHKYIDNILLYIKNNDHLTRYCIVKSLIAYETPKAISPLIAMLNCTSSVFTRHPVSGGIS